MFGSQEEPRASFGRKQIRAMIESSISNASSATASLAKQTLLAADAMPTYACELADGAAFIRQADGNWQLAEATAG
jgi:hypothetical protein